MNIYKDTYQEASGTLSTINRNMALAGIAVIWVFTKTDSGIALPHELICPMILLASSLCFDMLQYAYKTIAFYILFRTREKKKSAKQTHSPCINHPTWTFFWLKISCMFVAYIFIIVYLIKTII